MSPHDRCDFNDSGTSRCEGVTTSGLCASADGPRRDDLVPAERQVVGNRERRSTDQASVDAPRGHRCVGLGDLVPSAAGLRVELDPHLDRVTVLDVHGDVRLAALPQDDDGRQHATPRHVLDVGDGQVDPLRRRRVHPERAEHTLQRLGARSAVLTVEVPVVRNDPVGRGEA